MSASAQRNPSHKAKLRGLAGTVQRLNPVTMGLIRAFQQATGKMLLREPVQLLRALPVLLLDCRGLGLVAFSHSYSTE